MFLPVPHHLAQRPAALVAATHADRTGDVSMIAPGFTCIAVYAITMLALSLWDRHVLPRCAHWLSQCIDLNEFARS